MKNISIFDEGERIRREYDNIGLVFPTSEPNIHNLTYVPLPNIHPDTLKSIQLTQKIYDLIKSGTNLSKEIQKIYSALDNHEKYFFVFMLKSTLSTTTTVPFIAWL